MTERDASYLSVLLEPIEVCARYRPKFGQPKREGLSLPEFRTLYGSDPFYAWLGLDTPLMYAAHKAAGGITSVYRQIGIGCERLFRQILLDTLELQDEDVVWSYTITNPDLSPRRLSLDGRIPLDRIPRTADRQRIHDWIIEAATTLEVDPKLVKSLSGAVFEVRQGYKSKDSKRQNADIANAAAAYTQCYLPCVLVLSQQMDTDMLSRYRANRWCVLTGTVATSDATSSTYHFMRDIVGYDIAAFFTRHQTTLRSQISRVLESLLSHEPGVDAQ